MVSLVGEEIRHRHHRTFFQRRWIWLTALTLPWITGCQMGYIVKSAYHQAELLASRRPITEVMADPEIDPEVRRKLQLSQQARQFASAELGLKGTGNYQSYVELDRPYVTYAVSAAPKNSLEHYLWSFPMIGSVPYKGFFSLDDARAEEGQLQARNYDTYLRGVSAYSTLGWFDDPVLSSMMRYADYDLVNLIIHENVHATLYIRSQADFNEQLATFIGDRGTEIFFMQQEGPQSKTLRLARERSQDSQIFSDFISSEIADLESYYQNHQAVDESARQLRLKQIQDRFEQKIRPLMKTDNFLSFTEKPLNNARILAMKTYLKDLSQFAQAFDYFAGDFKKFLDFCRTLEDSKDPSAQLNQLVIKPGTPTKK